MCCEFKQGGPESIQIGDQLIQLQPEQASGFMIALNQAVQQDLTEIKKEKENAS